MDASPDDPVFRRYASAVQGAVGRVADQFRRAPASFLYESDLQGLLFARLFDELDGNSRPWAFREDHWREVASGEPLTVNPVKSEYPDGTLFDIAILAPDLDPSFNAWNQWVRVAIEIKFWQVWGRHLSFQGDQKKLDDYARKAHQQGRRFSGICLVFSHRAAEVREHVAQRSIVGNPPQLDVPEHGSVAWAITP